ncbi:MAG: hypothetical protein P4L84_18765 [Isosphaeraceae bacterium]|nr:hypothetical protein [Isosphaeraceae bacterium]
MNDGERRTRLTLEPLEGRVVPSSTVPSAPATTTALVQGAGYLFLNGSAQGHVHHAPTNPDAGSTITFRGHGQVTPLGAVKVSGSLQGTGFIRSGTAGGTVQLSNSHGSVTLSLEGPSQGGFTPAPSGTYQFHVVSGTGAFAKDLGDGTVDVNLVGDGISLTFHGAPNRY